MAGEIWTDAELEAAVAAYFQMLRLEKAGEPFDKAAVSRALLAGPLKGRTTAEQRMQNISAVMISMGRPWINGYKPLGNTCGPGGQRIRDAILSFDPPYGTPIPKLPSPEVGPTRDLVPTGIWELVCNRTKWDGEAWLRSGSSDLLYTVSEHNRSEVQVGDLAALRINAGSRRRPAGVYAILHVIEPPSERADDDDRFYVDKGDAKGLRWRARFKLLSNLVDAPLRAETLPDEAEFAHLKRALQTSSIPLALSAFKTILRLGDVDLLEINVAHRAEDFAGLADLASTAANLDPVVRHRMTKVIERGPIGERVKAARGHRCQVCEAEGSSASVFLKRDGSPYSEAHHVEHVAGLGAGSLGAHNIMVLCPNHHRQAHYGNFDIIEDTDESWRVVLDGREIQLSRTVLR